MYPKLLIDLKKLKSNLDSLSALTRRGGCSLMVVTKSFCADPRIVQEILKNEYVEFLADSRIQNLASYADAAHMWGKETVLLRLPQRCEIEETVRFADVSLNSDMETVKMLDRQAGLQNKTHRVILMVDMGDLREGMFYTDEAAILEACGEVLKMDHIKLEGIGVNLSCYGAILPKEDNLGRLCEIGEKAEKKYSIKLPMISGGNSSSLYLIDRGRLPLRVNNLRLGESFVLGRETAYGKPIEGTFSDAVRLRAQIIELKEKPSVPVGEVGMDAFGQVPVYEDRGRITRAILAVGKQDVSIEGLTPVNTGGEILGGSSDHLIMDVSGEDYRVGDTVDFTLDYGAMLKLFTSAYVGREYV